MLRLVQLPIVPFQRPRWITGLIDRTSELTKLKAAFENALLNRSSVVALQGEAGVGKTRLMQELGMHAQDERSCDSGRYCIRGWPTICAVG